MISLELIKKDKKKIEELLAMKGCEVNFDPVIEWDRQRREIIQEVESLKSQKNKVSAQIPALKKEGKDTTTIFEEMKLMLKGSVLAPKFKITRDKIIHTVSGSYCEPLSKEDGKSGDGTNINLLILDEYHQHQTTEFYDLFLGANSQEPLLIIITTAGMNLNAPCFTQEYKYCTDLLNRAIINETYFCDICETDDGDNIDDMRIWWKSNPIRMSYSEGVKKIKEAYDLAKQTPEKMVAFKTKCLCIWVQSVKDTYIPNDKFEACIVKKFPIDIKGKDVFIGVDLASKNDLCGITFHIPFNREIDNKIRKIMVGKKKISPYINK